MTKSANLAATYAMLRIKAVTVRNLKAMNSNSGRTTAYMIK